MGEIGLKFLIEFIWCRMATLDDSYDSQSSKDDDERLLEVTIVECNSDVDEERDEARDKLRRYADLRRTIQEHDNEEANEDEGEVQPTNSVDGDNRGMSRKIIADIGKITGYVSDYMDSSDPGSYESTSEDSDADDAKRHKSQNIYYDPNEPLKDFFVDLRFESLKQFKSVLVEFSTRKQFEFQYIKNDKVRVRAKCSAKGCKWIILCSWCNGRKTYVVKHYMAEHSCILGATKNKRVIAHVVAKNFGEMISAVPFIKPRQLKAMVRKELGVFITNKVCRNAKILVIK